MLTIECVHKENVCRTLRIVFLILSFSSFFPSVYGSHVYHFSITRSVSSDPMDFQLKLAFDVSVASPGEIVIGGSDKVSIDVDGAVSEVHYEESTLGTSGDQSFFLPIGKSNRMYVTSFFGGIFYYFEFSSTVSANITVLGNGRLSDNQMGWNSAGTESFIVTHTGNSEETLDVRLSFKYAVLLTIWKANSQGYFVAQEPHVLGGLASPASEKIQIVPSNNVSTSGSTFAVIIVLVSSSLAIGSLAIRKRKKHTVTSDR